MTERRALRRYELCLPVLVRVPALGSVSCFSGKIQNISAGGVHFSLNGALYPGAEISLTIALRPESTSGARVFIRGGGTVLRVDGCHKNRFGIAATLEGCEISRDAH
jgi:hypothetical protein